MSDLPTHDFTKLLFGCDSSDICFSNTGDDCWLNSLLRVIGAITGLRGLVLSYGPHYSDSVLAKNFTGVLQSLKNVNKPVDVQHLKQIILQSMIISSTHLKKKFDHIGQQSVPESFLLFLELLSNGRFSFLLNPFYHAHEIEGVCECGFKIRTEDRKKLISHYTEDNIEEAYYRRELNHECPKCKKLAKVKETLISTGSIIALTSKRRQFSKNFTVSAGTKKWKYILVAAVHHEGDIEGGHYYSTVLEKETYVTANDHNIIYRSKDPNPIENQVMGIYELLEVGAVIA